MAVNAASSSYVNKASSNRGFSGLASGVDTESMVEQMLAGTQNKIDKQNAIKQQIEWKQEIYRDIISQINTFHDKYFSYSSTSNLKSASFFNAMNAISSSSAFKATATTGATAGTSRVEVRRLATKSSLTSGAAVSGKLTGSVDTAALEKLVKAQLGTDEDYTVKFQVGTKAVSVNLRDVFVAEDGKTFTKMTTPQQDTAIQAKLEEAFKDTGVKVSVKDGAISLMTEGDNRSPISVSTDSGKLGLQRLGLTASSVSTNKPSAKTCTLSSKVSAAPTMDFNVTLDDVRKDIKIDLRDVMNPDGSINKDAFSKALEENLDKAHGKGQIRVEKNTDGSFELKTTSGRKVVMGGSEEALAAMGMKNGYSNRISTGSKLGDLNLGVPLQGGSFRFTINGEEFHFDEDTALIDVMDAINRSNAGVRLVYRAQDDSFVLESSEAGAGKEINLEQSEGNLLNALFGSGTVKTGSRAISKKLTYEVEETDEEGNKVMVTKEATGDTTLKELGIKGLNGADENTKLSDLQTVTNGRFIYEDGRIVAAKSYTATGANGKEAMEKLFGTTSIRLNEMSGAQAVRVEGQNALVKIDGLLTERSSNNFTVNGINYDISDLTGTYAPVAGTFYQSDGVTEITLQKGQYIENGTLYNADGTVNQEGVQFLAEGESTKVPATGILVGADGTIQKFTGSAATVTVSQNTDQIMDAIKGFMDDYNKLVKTLNDYLDEDTNYRDYAPLTADQKKEMSEREIELWEEKAKEGLLHRDSTIQTFLQSMRTALYQKPSSGGYALYELGIETGNWESKGQLVFTTDGEAKLRQMLENDPTGIIQLFTDPEEGLSTKLSTIINDTAKTSSGSPGTLVQIAGVKGLASEKDNSLYDQLKAIDNKIATLKRTYEMEKTRYWKQFTTMEQLISNMNTQSSYLAQMMGM